MEDLFSQLELAKQKEVQASWVTHRDRIDGPCQIEEWPDESVEEEQTVGVEAFADAVTSVRKQTTPRSLSA